MTARRTAAVLVAITAALAGCARAETPGGPVAAAVGPSALVGLWHVSDAQGENDDTWLRLDARDLTVLRPCGGIFGGWRAAGSTFVAATYGWSAECSTQQPEVPWLDEAATYRLTADGADLLDDTGEIVAALTVDGAPDPDDDQLGAYVAAPSPDPSALAALVPAPLPAGVKPATTERIIDRWVPQGVVATTDPGVTFDASGRYSSTDGCNGTEGAWAVVEEGWFLATAGPITAMWCEGAPVPTIVGTASRAGFDGATLVLLDHAGAELGQFTRG